VIAQMNWRFLCSSRASCFYHFLRVRLGFFCFVCRRPFVNGSQSAIGPLSDCMSVCLSLTLVYYCQTVGWIKMKLGMEDSLGPGHIVLDRDPAPLPTGAHPHFSAHVLWPNGWLDQEATWYGGRHRARPHF